MIKFGEKFSIFWKILFWLDSIALVIFSFKKSSGPSHDHISEQMGLILGLVIFLAFVAFGYFWSLGYKKKLYTDTFNNIILGLLTLLVIGGPISLAFRGTMNSTTEIIASALTSAVVIILAVIVTSPFYLALILYKKISNTFEAIEAPFTKLLSMFYILTLEIDMVFGKLYHYFISTQAHTLTDFVYYPLRIYELIFLCGVAFDKQIFPQKFWQYTAIPFFVLSIMELYSDKKSLNTILHYPLTLQILTAVIIFILFKILYDYAFTTVVYKTTID